MNERYEQMITELFALASEATVRANERKPGEMLQWRYFARQAYTAAVDAAGRADVDDERLNRLGDEADAIAVGRIGGF